jgi:hypothetical protein
MTLTTGPGEADKPPIDDYHVDREIGRATRPVSHHALSLIQALLLLVMAAVSLALFWVVAALLGVV